MIRLGRMLQKVRKRRGHTLKDVAAAVGRGISWVSDVEHGRRGSRMDPVLAFLWADYLSIDPGQLLEATGLSGHHQELARVRHYLETGQWAHKFIRAKSRLVKALELAERIATDAPLSAGIREDALSLKSEISGVITLLRIPRNGKDGENDGA